MMLYGLEVCPNSYMTKSVPVYPKDRFVEYGPEDHWWLSAVGLLRHKTVPSTDVFRVGNKLVMHPTMVDKLKAELASRKDVNVQPPGPVLWGSV